MTRRRRWAIGLAGFVVALAAASLPLGRMRYLAIPLAHDPSLPAAAARLALSDDDAPADTAARLPGRISAILPVAGGALFVATFDHGLYRLAPGGPPVEVAALDGRERFVDALVAWRGQVVAGTHRGAIVLSAAGARTGVLAAGEAVSSLAIAGDERVVGGGELAIGTAHGLWRGSDDAPVGERGPDGETLRVTALAAAGDRLFIGTPEGVYSVAAPLTAQAARWRPLVFGPRAAASNVVTALAALADGSVVAGTDDGGLVAVRDGATAALSFADPRANDINPGALVRVGGALFAGTEGAGLVTLDAGWAPTRARRLGPRARISAVAAAGPRLWLGSEDGTLASIALRSMPYQASAASKIF